MLKIKITNKTDWPTAEFRRLFLACAKHEGLDYDGTYTVQLYYTRGGGGWGTYHCRNMKIALPNRDRYRDRATTVDATWVAYVIIHEMCHNRGLKHKDMDEAANQSAANEVCAALGMTVLHRDTKAQRAKAAAPKPTREDKAQAEFDRIEAHIAELEKKHEQAIRRWTKKLRKARASVRRYVRNRIAAAAEPAVCKAAAVSKEAAEPKTKIPTVAAIKKTCSRHTGSNVVSIDVGTREGGDGQVTENQLEWPDENDLVDFVSLAGILAGWRKSDPGAVSLDMYCYDREGLVDNVDLFRVDGVWVIGIRDGYTTEVK